MIYRAANWLCRSVLILAYPILSRLEDALGIRSNVAVVAVWHGERLLLIRHSYRLGEALPGGTIGISERPADAAARELHEEVGILVSPGELVPLRSWRQKKGDTWLFEYRPRALPRVVPDQREVVAARFVPRDRIPHSIGRLLGESLERHAGGR